MMLEGEALYLTWANLYGSCEVNSQQPGTHDLRRLVRRASPISTEMRMAVQIINWWCEHQKCQEGGIKGPVFRLAWTVSSDTSHQKN